MYLDYCINATLHNLTLCSKHYYHGQRENKGFKELKNVGKTLELVHCGSRVEIQILSLGSLGLTTAEKDLRSCVGILESNEIDKLLNL